MVFHDQQSVNDNKKQRYLSLLISEQIMTRARCEGNGRS
uniref:Uncharacterized protein n=1 Tax=Arundo donax TaxID=35708 RepID=A0A0A9FLL7_ARUDO